MACRATTAEAQFRRGTFVRVGANSRAKELARVLCVPSGLGLALATLTLRHDSLVSKELSMTRTTLACVAILAISACASDAPSRRHPATARAETDAQRREQRSEVAHDVDTTEGDRLARDHDRVVVHDRSATQVERVPVAAVPAPENRSDARAVTPGERRETASDAEITRRIRKAVTQDDALTADAKNVKIVTEEGRVTLRGNVSTAREKTTVETYAQQVAGAGNVQSQLAVP
jgi:osmotically-inducible protein OsmY